MATTDLPKVGFSYLGPQVLRLAEDVPDQGVQVSLRAQQGAMVRRQPPHGVESVENLWPVVPWERCHRPLQLLARVRRRPNVLCQDVGS